MFIQDQFGIIQNLQTFPIPQTSFLVRTIFAASYSKMALSKFQCSPFNNDIAPVKNSKINNCSPTFIPDSRVLFQVIGSLTTDKDHIAQVSNVKDIKVPESFDYDKPYGNDIILLILEEDMVPCITNPIEVPKINSKPKSIVTLKRRCSVYLWLGPRDRLRIPQIGNGKNQY